MRVLKVTITGATSRPVHVTFGYDADVCVSIEAMSSKDSVVSLRDAECDDTPLLWLAACKLQKYCDGVAGCGGDISPYYHLLSMQQS